MRAYVTNKVLSLGIVFLYLISTFYIFGYNEEQWKVILIGLLIMGYAHFFIGSYYQLKSFGRSSKPQLHYLTFIILSIFSVVFSYFVFDLFGFVAALFIGIIYFLVHGLFNEQTLLLKQTKQFLPLQYILALAIFLFSLLVYALPNETFFFDNNLNFVEVNDLMVNYYFNNYFLSVSHISYIFWSGVMLSIVVLVHAWWKNRHTKTTLFLGSFFVFVTGLVAYTGTPTYIYVYTIVVGYHFLTWLIFYIHEKYKRGKNEALGFFGVNLCLLTTLVVLSYYHFDGRENIMSSFFFDYRTFIVLTYIHISTSFMNDEWFKSTEIYLYNKFKRR